MIPIISMNYGGLRMKRKLLAILSILLILFVFAACTNDNKPQDEDNPGQDEPDAPVIVYPDKLTDEEVIGVISITGLVQDILSEEDVEDLDVIWSTAAPAEEAQAQILDIMPKAGETASKLYATVTLTAYSGRGVIGSGISISGTMVFTFNCTTSVDTVTIADITSYTAESGSDMIITQSNGYRSNTYTVSDISGIEGNAKATVKYTAGPDKLEVTVSAAASDDTITVSSTISATVGKNEIITESAWDGESYSTAWYESSPDATEFTIDSAEELAGLAIIVNEKTDDFLGDTITLAADIDLGSHDWTPIGGIYIGTGGTEIYSEADDMWIGFKGTFDGGNNTISNLSIGSQVFGGDTVNTDNSYKGLFGNIESGASIRNLTIHNAEISADGFAGVFAGHLPKASTGSYAPVVFDNLHVTGTLRMNGKFSIGGILGRNENGATQITMTDCHVDVDDGSYIRMPVDIVDYGPSYSYFGGLVGALYSQNENVISDCSVAGLSITGYLTPVGGLVGLVNKVIFEGGNTITDVALGVADHLEEGGEPYARAGALAGFIMSSDTITLDGSFALDGIVISYPFAKDISEPACNGLFGAMQGDGSNPTIDVSSIDTEGKISFVYIDITP